MLERGSVAVVTGAAGGIGLAITEAIAAEGVAVACLERPGADVSSFIQVCEKHGVAWTVETVDVANQADVARAVEAAERLGSIRYAVNCAGTNHGGRSESLSADQWQELIDVDLSGVFFSCQAEFAAMERSGGGSIVNIASMSGSIINRNCEPSAGYFAAKAGVAHLSRGLGVEWVTRGVRVNSLSPGYTMTAMTAKNPPDVNAAFCADIPMGRMAETREIAGPTLFLLSDLAAYVVAFDLVVDGGYTAW